MVATSKQNLCDSCERRLSVFAACLIKSVTFALKTGWHYTAEKCAYYRPVIDDKVAEEYIRLTSSAYDARRDAIVKCSKCGSTVIKVPHPKYYARCSSDAMEKGKRCSMIMSMEVYAGFWEQAVKLLTREKYVERT